jgi:DNA-binding LacI/PurR family transcriptional regulator
LLTIAANQAVDHLYALGHRRIVYRAGSRSCSNTARFDGFKAACTRLDVECRDIDLDDSRFSAGVPAAIWSSLPARPL